MTIFCLPLLDFAELSDHEVTFNVPLQSQWLPHSLLFIFICGPEFLIWIIVIITVVRCRESLFSTLLYFFVKSWWKTGLVCEFCITIAFCCCRIHSWDMYLYCRYCWLEFNMYDCGWGGNQERIVWAACLRNETGPEKTFKSIRNTVWKTRKKIRKTMRNAFEKLLAPLRPLKNISPALFNKF